MARGGPELVEKPYLFYFSGEGGASSSSIGGRGNRNGDAKTRQDRIFLFFYEGYLNREADLKITSTS